MKWMQRFWCSLTHHWNSDPGVFPNRCEFCAAPDMKATRQTIAQSVKPFNWLEDYGPYWEPGSTAFWLEPRKGSDLIAWLRKYRPEFRGTFEAAGLSVEVVVPPAHPLSNMRLGYQSLAAMQAHPQQAQMQAVYGVRVLPF